MTGVKAEGVAHGAAPRLGMKGGDRSSMPCLAGQPQDRQLRGGGRCDRRAQGGHAERIRASWTATRCSLALARKAWSAALWLEDSEAGSQHLKPDHLSSTALC